MSISADQHCSKCPIAWNDECIEGHLITGPCLKRQILLHEEKDFNAKHFQHIRKLHPILSKV